MSKAKSIADYEILDEVGRGACGVVYKARKPSSDHVIALKLLRSNLTEAVVETLRFEREFRLASTCDHPNLVKTFEYGNCSGRPYYTMELVPGVPFNQRFAGPLKSGDREAFAKVVDGIFEALEYIHEKRIVHRDLKPENVLVTADNQPRILDFGLARPQQAEEAPKLTDPGTVLGTIYYLSPEQLSARPLDGRSDLFSVGTMLYEALSGRVPFKADHPIGVFGQILSQEPAPLDLPEGFPAELERLVKKLMQKEPANRYKSAGAALAAWRRVMFGLKQEVKVRRVETAEELYMPKFVGQSEALDTFRRMLGKKGPRVLFVQGKAGAGKSRFLEEVTAIAQAKGYAHQGARAGSQDATPYQLWIPPLRQAFKFPEPSIVGLRSVLSTLLPELGHSRASATSKSQLFEGMARVLKTQQGVLWLDDIHLADAASLEFLHYLTRRVSPEEQLTVVATYNPDIPAPLLKKTYEAMVGAEFAVGTRLVPLKPEETAEMVSSMMAGVLEKASAGSLHREAGGNPLHIGEAVKAALAEGRLKQHEGRWTLRPPVHRPLTGTIRDQLEKQLQSLKEQDRQILELAALLGFDFNFDVLAQVSDVPKVHLLDSVLNMSDKGFLIESEDVTFRFGSRALHQVLLESVPRPEREPLHLRVAQALEKLKPRNRWVVEVALHYEAAGSLEIAATHLLTAGAEASRNFAHEDALEYYQRVLLIPSEQRLSNDVILEKIGKAKQGLGRFEEARKQFEDLLSRAAAPVTKVRLRRRVAECQQMLGRFPEAHENLTEGLRLLGAGPDGKAPKATPVKWAQKLFKELSTKFQSHDIMSHQLHRILDRQLSNLFFLRPSGWTDEVFRLALLQEDVARKLGHPESLAQAQIFLGFVELHNERREKAIEHWENGFSVASDLRDTPYKALLIRNMGLMHLLAGNAERAHQLCLITHKISESLSDRPGLTQVQMVLCAVELHWARFDKALVHAQAMLDTADDAGLPVFRALGLSYLARACARNDRLEEARSYLARAEESGAKMNLPYVDMLLWVARAWVHCDSGSHQECLQAAERGMAFCQEIRSLPFYPLTLRCAALWSSVEEAVQGRKDDELKTKLEKFRDDSAHHGVVQFVGIAEELLKRLSHP